MDKNTAEFYMARCLQLAKNGFGKVAPNPMVGSVIVCDGKIIGEGYHQKCGEAHAEVNAIASVIDQSLLKHSTLYVNLEPCSHHGKTPPCSDLMIEKGIPHVVVGSTDPHALVNGTGLDRLRKAGIKVQTGVLEKECDILNKRFFTFHKKQRPYIILKWAQSADGFIDKERKEGEQGVNWITAPSTKKITHLWRSQEAAILVGTNTALIDNPELSTRAVTGKNPIRVLIDRELKVPNDNLIFNDASKTLVFNARQSKEEGSTSHIQIDFEDNVLEQLLSELHQRNIQSLRNK